MVALPRGIALGLRGFPHYREKPRKGRTMPNISSLRPRLLAASLTLVSVLGSVAWAQQPPTVRIRGTIESVDGAMLAIKSREGTDMKVLVTDNVAVVRVAHNARLRLQPRCCPAV